MSMSLQRQGRIGIFPFSLPLFRCRPQALMKPSRKRPMTLRKEHHRHASSWFPTVTRNHLHDECRNIYGSNLCLHSYCRFFGVGPNDSINDVAVVVDDDDETSGAEKYRNQPMTAGLWQEFQAENERTIAFLDPHVCTQMLEEIHAAFNDDLQLQVSSSDQNGSGREVRHCEANGFSGESGPTGKWLYRFDVAEDGKRRVYQRFRCDDDGHDDDSNGRKWQVVLDVESNVEILAMSLTPDESCVAALVQVHDERRKTNEIRLRNIASGGEKTIPVRTQSSIPIAKTVASIEWGANLDDDDDDDDDQCDGPLNMHERPYLHHTLCFLYTDHQGRPNRVLAARIHPETMDLVNGELPSIVFESNDPAVMVGMQRTKGGRYIAIEASTKTSNEIFLTTGNPSMPLKLVRPRQDGVLYHLDSGPNEIGVENVVMLVGDEHRENGEYWVMEASVESLPVSDLPHAEFGDANPNGYSITDMDLFQKYLVLYERCTKTGTSRIRIKRRHMGASNGEKAEQIVQLPDFDILPWSKIVPFGNIHYDAKSLSFHLESPVAPGATFEYNFESMDLRRLSGNTTNATLHYTFEKVFVESIDGNKVPMSLFYHSNNGSLDRHGSSHEDRDALLIGYGAYGEPIGLDYNPTLKPLLDRGMILAFAHTRGGGDLGRAWYRAGNKDKKIRGIEDFEACAFYLKRRFPDGRLSAKGFSAGGVIVGAAVNRNPGLFDKVVLVNAFLDVLATMQNPSLFLTEHEYDEFGNPSTDQNIAALIRSYCPIVNLRPEDQEETEFLLVGTLDDVNVPYWNPALYFYKLTNGTGKCEPESRSKSALLHIQREGGHHGTASDRITMQSLENVFLLS